MSYYLFLDDSRKVSDVYWAQLPENVEWTIAHNYEEFTRIVREKGMPKFISYDCDLCEEHYNCLKQHGKDYLVLYQQFNTKCGIHCLKWMNDFCYQKGVKHPENVVHTMNYWASKYMRDLIAAHDLQFPLEPSLTKF